MRYLLLLSTLLLFSSCNKVRETIYSNLDLTDTIDENEYRMVVDDKNRRGYITADNEIMQGHYAIKRENILIESFEIDGGFLDGKQVYYYENGQPESILNYSHSYKNGEEVNFYRNGVIRSTRTHKNGIELNDEIKYGQDGSMFSKKEEIDGILHTHMYENDKRRVTTFEKEIEGDMYNFAYVYSAFETIQFVLGNKKDTTDKNMYIFNTQFELLESINPVLNPERVNFYFQQMADY